MKRLLIPASCLLLLAQCNFTHSIDRSQPGPWNENNVWVPLHGAPGDYVPADFKSRPSSHSSDGEWVVDPQDHARFYIPAKGTAGYAAGVLRGEAFKATNRHSMAGQRFRNAMQIATLGLSNPTKWDSSWTSADPAKLALDNSFDDNYGTANNGVCDNKGRSDGGRRDAACKADGPHGR